MLTPPRIRSRRRRQERRLWSDGKRNSYSLGCARCPDRPTCGGLQIKRAVFDCLDLCCGRPEDCDAVCRRRPEDFVRRVREVGGFAFDNVLRAGALAVPPLPAIAPMIFHGKRRSRLFSEASTVCLSLYQVIARHDGQPRYANKLELANRFRISPHAQLILTGTAVDPPLERWWSLGERRRDAIQALRKLGIALVTTPNFSLFPDQPRWDDLHSMKRIALVHHEFLSSGMPVALHVNARTDRDWERWREYVSKRAEVTHVAFEFRTGAGRAERVGWYTDHLLRLASSVGRPLHLILRGQSKTLPMLARGFSALTFLESSAFNKTRVRQRATMTRNGSIHWHRSPTAKDEPLDGLLAENWRVVSAAYHRTLSRYAAPIGATG